MRKTLLFVVCFGTGAVAIASGPVIAQTRSAPVADVAVPARSEDSLPPARPAAPADPSLNRDPNPLNGFNPAQGIYREQPVIPSRNAYVAAPYTTHSVDPKVAEIAKAEADLSVKVRDIMAKLRQNPAAPDSTDLEGQLRKTLEEQFDLQQKRRAAEVAALENRLKKLNDAIKQRTAAKDLIVNRMYELLVTGQDPFAWDDHPAYSSVRPMPMLAPAYASDTVYEITTEGTLRAPTRVPPTTSAPSTTLTPSGTTAPSATPAPVPPVPPVSPNPPTSTSPRLRGA